jgi:hypothetical protein
VFEKKISLTKKEMEFEIKFAFESTKEFPKMSIKYIFVEKSLLAEGLKS